VLADHIADSVVAQRELGGALCVVDLAQPIEGVVDVAVLPGALIGALEVIERVISKD
jgi:hypothetical protein